MRPLPRFTRIFPYLTCDDQLGADASQFFNSVTGRTKLMRFRKLYPSPVLMKARLIELIEGEAERARQGNPPAFPPR